MTRFTPSARGFTSKSTCGVTFKSARGVTFKSARGVTFKKSRGFTLIEILIVLIIIGLGAGMVSLATSDRRVNELRTLSERFAAFSELAAEQAALGGEPLGLKWEVPLGDDVWRYRWYRFRDNQWEPAEEPFTETVLPDFARVVVEVDGVNILEREDTVALTKSVVERNEKKTITPDIVFFTSGEVTPFEVEFGGAELQEDNQHIKVDMLGRITWEEAHEG